MAYSADTFTAGEIPTTAKWNKLWANDADFDSRITANVTEFADSFRDFTLSGGIWTAATGLNGNMTAWTGYLAGKKYTISAVTNHLFTASKDTWIDVNSSGALVYTEVATGAAAPALAAGSYRLGMVPTGTTTVTSAGIKSGLVAGTQFDSLGNRIRRTRPMEKLLGSGRRTTLINPAGALTEIPELAMTVIIPKDGYIVLSAYCYLVTNNVAGSRLLAIYDTNSSGTLLSQGQIGNGTLEQQMCLVTTEPVYYAAGSKTFKVYCNGANTSNFNAGATTPLWSRCEMI